MQEHIVIIFLWRELANYNIIVIIFIPHYNTWLFHYFIVIFHFDITLVHHSSQVVIFSKSYCPYCTNTKLLFATNFVKKDIKIIELDQVINGREIQSTLYQMTGQRTVPSVFVHGHFIGGNDDTIASFESGKLQAILQ